MHQDPKAVSVRCSSARSSVLEVLTSSVCSRMRSTQGGSNPIYCFVIRESVSTGNSISAATELYQFFPSTAVVLLGCTTHPAPKRLARDRRHARTLQVQHPDPCRPSCRLRRRVEWFLRASTSVASPGKLVHDAAASCRDGHGDGQEDIGDRLGDAPGELRRTGAV